MTKGQHALQQWWHGTVGKFRNFCPCKYSMVVLAEGESLCETLLTANHLCLYLALNAASFPQGPRSWWPSSFFSYWYGYPGFQCQPALTIQEQRNYRLFPQWKWKTLGPRRQNCKCWRLFFYTSLQGRTANLSLCDSTAHIANIHHY